MVPCPGRFPRRRDAVAAEEEKLYKCAAEERKLCPYAALIIRMRVIMAAATCSPAAASRGAKYDDDFRVPTLLGAQPLDAQQFFR
jgi:hypothetical protein